MFSVDKMFRDVARRLRRDVKRRVGLSEGIHEWINYCETQFPARIWSRLRKLDFEMDFDRLTVWLLDLLAASPPPQAINGLWFGLHNPANEHGEPSCGLYLSGSRRFNKPDWHCSTDYWPAGRYASSDVLPAIFEKCETLPDDGPYLGEAALCHGYVALVVARWCRGPIRSRLLGNAKTRGVAMGHDSGDVYLIDVLKSDKGRTRRA
jgi:hypothetical protein